MRKFSIDYQNLDQTINKRAYRFDQVKDNLVKIAFDVVKFKDDAIEGLWKIEKSPDGDLIVALYEESIQKSASLQKASPWKVIASQDKSKLSFIYKNEPILQTQAQDLGIDNEDVDFALSWLPQKLSENHNLRKSLLSFASSDIRSRFPELYEDQ